MVPEEQRVGLLVQLVHNRMFLASSRTKINADDLKPDKKNKVNSRDYCLWIAATVALEYWDKYKEAIGTVLPEAFKQYVVKAGLSKTVRIEGREFCKSILKKKPQHTKYLEDTLTAIKQSAAANAALERVVELYEKEELTASALRGVMSEFEAGVTEQSVAQNFTKDYKRRALDRIRQESRRFFPIFIDEIDQRYRILGRGHLGCVLGSYKGGKSKFLLHLWFAYAYQGLNTVFITLEDPGEEVETRADSWLTGIPMKELSERYRPFLRKFKKRRVLLQQRMRLLDLSARKVSMPDIEAELDKLVSEGFIPDVVLIDYDDEVKPTTKHKDRRLELADVYRDMRFCASSRNVLLWTAAQAVRGTADKAVLSADDLAEDISKARKVHCLLTLGTGTDPNNKAERTLRIAEHKYDEKGSSFTLVGDPACSRIVNLTGGARNTNRHQGSGIDALAEVSSF